MLESTGVQAVLRLTSWSRTFSNGELPSHVGMTVPGPVRVLCVAPDEWLFISHERDASSIREAEPRSAGAVLVDITDGIAAFEMRGPTVRDILAQGCGLDLHPKRFPADRCARTRFAQITVVID